MQAPRTFASYVVRSLFMHFTTCGRRAGTLDPQGFPENESGLQFPEGRQFVGCGCWIDGSDCSLFSKLICTISDQMRSKIRYDAADIRNHGCGYDDHLRCHPMMATNTLDVDCMSSSRSGMIQ